MSRLRHPCLLPVTDLFLGPDFSDNDGGGNHGGSGEASATDCIGFRDVYVECTQASACKAKHTHARNTHTTHMLYINSLCGPASSSDNHSLLCVAPNLFIKLRACGHVHRYVVCPAMDCDLHALLFDPSVRPTFAAIVLLFSLLDVVLTAIAR